MSAAKRTFRIQILGLGLLLSFWSTGAEACYTAREIEAEQGVRIHSELMIIGLTCMKLPGGDALYNQYTKFTRANEGLLASYERDLIQHYRQQGGAAEAERRLHTLRTGMANDISRRAIAMGTAGFCGKYASYLRRAVAMDTATVRRWAQQRHPARRTSESACF